MRKALALVSAVLVLLVALAVGPVGAQKGPIKIGFLAPMTGGAAQIGKDMTNGLQMWLDENNGNAENGYV